MNNIDPAIFKAYDIRGTYPTQVHAEVAYSIAQGYAKFLGLKSGQAVAVGRDVRTSGPVLWEGVKNGLIDCGIQVIDIGIVSTDMMYFAVANYGYDGGIQVSASHNPREFNGFKLVRAKAAPISGDTGIQQIKELVLSGYKYQIGNGQAGKVEQKDVLDDYIAKVLSVVDVSAIKPLKVVANCNFGAVGMAVKRLAEKLPITITYLNDEPNGEFPKGRPDPYIPENRLETSALIKSAGADLGVAWDADADRCFFFDEQGNFLPGYFTTTILAEHFFQKQSGAKIVIDPRLVWATQDMSQLQGGQILLNKAGHSFIKERMIHEDAIFGGENSGHYYFKEFFYLDNGLIPFLLMLAELSKTQKKISELYSPLFKKYFATEEINSTVEDPAKVLAELKEKYADGKLLEIDGVSIEYPTWRFNVRPSNTEALIRLNLEAKTSELREEKQAEVLAVIRKN